MKQKIFLMMLFFASLIFTTSTRAQVSININIGNQPAWGPEGYDDAQYYYMPDMDIYYDVPAHQFVYLTNNRWMRSNTLPPAYRSYDLYHVHKVPLNEKNAYINHERDRKTYSRFQGKADQKSIRDSRDEKYNGSKNNWQNNRFKKQSDPGRKPEAERDDHNDHHRNNERR